MVEADMRFPIVDWLNQQGYEDAHECQMGGYCDVIGFRFARRTNRRIPQLLTVIAIELKMSNVAQVVGQAIGNLYYSNASYAAMPQERCNKMRETTKRQFLDNGIGLLSVDRNIVKVLIAPKYMNDGREQNYKRTWWRWHLKHSKGETK